MHRRPPYRPLPLAVLVAACAAPEPWQAPPLETSVTHHGGSALTGVQPVAAEASSTEDAVVLVHCKTAWRETMPTGLDALQSHIAMVMSNADAQPFRAVSRLAVGARIGTMSAPAAEEPQAEATPPDQTERRAAPAAEQSAPVARGTTATFSLRHPEIPDAHVDILVSRDLDDATGLTIALALTGTPVQPDGDLLDDDPDDVTAAAVCGELVVLEPRLTQDATPLCIALPTPFGSAGATLTIELSARAEHGEEVLRAARAAMEEANQRAEAAADRSTPVAFARIRLHELRESCKLLQETRSRTVLLQLAESTGAELTADFAVVASFPTIQAFTRELFVAEHAPLTLALSGVELGYALDEAVYQHLGRRLDADELSPALRSVLVRQAGAAADPGTIEDLFVGTRSLTALNERLIEENEFGLRARSAATRMRAFEWLSVRGREPAGYDPLAERDARKRALAAARRKETGR